MSSSLIVLPMTIALSPLHFTAPGLYCVDGGNAPDILLVVADQGLRTQALHRGHCRFTLMAVLDAITVLGCGCTMGL